MCVKPHAHALLRRKFRAWQITAEQDFREKAMLVKMLDHVMAIAAKVVMPAVQALPLCRISDGGVEK